MRLNMTIWSGMCAVIAVVSVLGLAAQQPATAQNGTNSSPGRVTVTGCVQRAPASPVGTSGSVGASANDTKFLLSNATNAKTSADIASSSMASSSSYRLDADDAKLTPHVGHKVEITGTIDMEAKSPAGSPSASAAPRLKVDTVQMIASSCS